MTTISVTLSDELRAAVDREVAEGGYESAAAYVQALIRDAQRRRHAKQTLDAKLCEALDGEPATPMTREDWNAVERKAVERWEREQRS